MPDEVAVLGVDNDPVLCELCDPPLSSVIPDARQAGYRAAELLDRWMAGKSVPAEAHRIAPLGIHTRQSTDVLAIDDKGIAATVPPDPPAPLRRDQRGRLAAPGPPVPPGADGQFTHYLGRSPHAEILRVRLNRVKQLLVETDLSVEAIAQLAGFEHPEYLSVAFKREVGLRPRAYREQHHVRHPLA